MADVVHQPVQLYVPCAHACLRREQHLNVFQVVVLVHHQQCYVWKLPKSTQENWNGKKNILEITWLHMTTKTFDGVNLKKISSFMYYSYQIRYDLFWQIKIFSTKSNHHWPSWWSKAMGTADSIRAPWLERKPSWKIIPTGSPSSIFLERYSWSWGYWQTLNSKKHNHPQMTQHARKHRPCHSSYVWYTYNHLP